MKNILPIGTVVILKEGTKKVMITGYKSKTPDSDKVYDYNGCIFPEGFIENVYCLFNQSEVDEVFYLGMENEESKNFRNQIVNDEIGFGVSTLNGAPANDIATAARNFRKRTAPTKPMSISEMRSKYGINLTSGGNIFNYKTGK